jgi:signal transduction histidine kinase
LARELHDSLGQTLAATHLQASTARLLLARGDTVQTDRCLEEMSAMTMAAEADVRDYLLGAKTTYSADLPFFPALCLYVERFGRQYGLQIGLNVPQHIETQGLAPAIEVQLMRIIQEALSNVRKHAGAQEVRIEFASTGPLLQVKIRDDGQGFDPGDAARQPERYGLQAMRERAEELGGRCRVNSQPGQGAEVIVKVPLNSGQASKV